MQTPNVTEQSIKVTFKSIADGLKQDLWGTSSQRHLTRCRTSCVCGSFLKLKQNGAVVVIHVLQLFSFNIALVEVRNVYGVVSLLPTGEAEITG